MSRDPSKPLRAGELNHFVTITAPPGVLHESDTVAVADNVPMAITVLPLQFQERERLGQGGLQTQTIYTLTCRYREDLRPSFVLAEQCCTTRTFQILAIVPSDRKDALDMTCTTRD